MRNETLEIGVIGYEGVTGQDFVGPTEAFAIAVAYAMQDGAEVEPYRIRLLSFDGKPFVSESGIIMVPHCKVEDAVGQIDTLMIPGGMGLREPGFNAQITEWLIRHAAGIRRIVSICTGIYGLAPSGLLDGREATTHWRFAADVAARFPKVRIDRNAIFCKDGPCYTSAGITAGIDLALALIEADLGPQMALKVARDLVVYLKRPGGQDQYSEPLPFQAQAGDRFADLVVWIAKNLGQDLSNDVLARKLGLSSGHFARQFRTEFGYTPAAFVNELRLGEAGRQLTRSNRSIEDIARSSGFQNMSSFQRAFERRYALAPALYRKCFGSPLSSAF